MLRTLEIAFPSFLISLFSGGRGNAPRPPPQGKGAYGPFSGHDRLLNLQWLLITVVETPQGAARVVYSAVENMAPEQKQA